MSKQKRGLPSWMLPPSTSATATTDPYAGSGLDAQDLLGNDYLQQQMNQPFGPSSIGASMNPWAAADPLHVSPYSAAPTSGPYREGFAGNRIHNHYGDPLGGVPNQTAEERDRVLDLDGEAGRKAALSGFRQNANPLDEQGRMRCGPTALVAGMVYAGGKDGAREMLDAIDQDRKAGGLKGLSSPELDAVRKKLADPGASLTQQDLDVLADKSFEHFREQGADPSRPIEQQGTRLDDLQKFVSSHASVKQRFAANEMSLDSIDLSGDGQGEHIVLGVGHRGSGGIHDWVYDPQARQDKTATWESLPEAERARYIEEAEGASWFSSDAQVLEDAKQRAASAYVHDSQVVEDERELADYRKATDRSATAGGTVDHAAQTKADRY